MELLNKLLGRPGGNRDAQQISEQADRSAPMPSVISQAIAERECALSKAIQIPYSEIAQKGNTLMQLAPALKSFIRGNKIGNGSLVRVVFPKGVKGKLALDSNGQALGGILKKDGGLAQARLSAIDPFSLASQAAMAAVIIQINQRLDTIQKTQQQILGFLERDKQAEQQGDLNVLTGILEGYQYNWDNVQYIQNQSMKVADIKQSAERNLAFYQGQIADTITKLSAIHLESAIRPAVADLSKQLANYRMAVYLHSFAIFLEVMLNKNYSSEYLNQLAEKVQDNNTRYQSDVSSCRDLIRKLSAGTIDAKVSAWLGDAGHTIGNALDHVPLLSKWSVNQWFREQGNALLKGNDKRTENAAALLDTREETNDAIFVDCIRSVNAICNQATDILFDENALYLAVK